MTYGYMTEVSGYNVWMKGCFGKNNELKGSTMELITMEEGNALIGHVKENEFVIHMCAWMATIWCEEARNVCDGIPMYGIDENESGDPDIQDYIEFNDLIVETAKPDYILFKDEQWAWEKREEERMLEMAGEPIEEENPLTEVEEIEWDRERWEDEIAENRKKFEESGFDLSGSADPEPPELVERLREIRKYLKEHPEEADEQ